MVAFESRSPALMVPCMLLLIGTSRDQPGSKQQAKQMYAALAAEVEVEHMTHFVMQGRFAVSDVVLDGRPLRKRLSHLPPGTALWHCNWGARTNDIVESCLLVVGNMVRKNEFVMPFTGIQLTCCGGTMKNQLNRKRVEVYQGLRPFLHWLLTSPTPPPTQATSFFKELRSSESICSQDLRQLLTFTHLPPPELSHRGDNTLLDVMQEPLQGKSFASY